MFCPKCQSNISEDAFYTFNDTKSSGWCKSCMSKHKIDRYTTLRLEAITRYGGECESCKESNNRKLRLVSKYGQNSTQQKTSRFYAELQEYGYPDTWRVMCVSCHTTKAKAAAKEYRENTLSREKPLEVAKVVKVETHTPYWEEHEAAY